jgi:hypothetical protein
MQIGVCSWIPRDPSQELETQINIQVSREIPKKLKSKRFLHELLNFKFVLLFC